MSVQAITWALEVKVGTPSQKLVLVCLANYANKDGLAYPGQRKIAEESGLSLRTVNTCLKRLEEAGFIARERREREDGSRTSDLYFLQINPMQPLHVDDVGNMQSTTCQHATIAHQYKAKALSEPVREPSDARETEEWSGFSEFWDQYPRKVAKPLAGRAYLKALRKYPHAQILAGTIRHSTAWGRDNQDPRFIPHPSTFLNQERFNDEPQTHKPVSRADERTAEIEKFKRLVGERFGACGPGEDSEEIIDIRPGDGYIRETQGGPGG